MFKTRLLLLSFTATFAAAQPVALVNPDLEKSRGHGSKRSIVEAKGGDGSFAEALRLQVAKQPPNQWDAQLSLPTTGPVKKDNIITVSMWVRGAALDAADGSALIELVFERLGTPYTKSIQYPVFLTEDWQHITTKFRSAETYDEPAGAHVSVNHGYLAGWYEIAGVQVLNHGADADFDALPSTPITYVGRAADAAWRAKADARIEKHRKADLRIIVVDKEGKRVPGAKVRAVQRSHDFAFGTAVGVRQLMERGDDAERYRAELQKYFNSTTIENALKWKAWEAKWPGANRTDAALDVLGELGLSVRGHVMVWPGWRYLSEEVKALAGRPEALRGRVLDHIASVAGATRGRVVDWDVVNELYDNQDLTSVLGEDAPISWFKAADALLPDTDLYYNDYAALVSAGLDTGHKQHFEKTVRGLTDGGAPLDGIGLQGHFGMLLTPPDRLVAELDRWAQFGLKIKVTEFDVVMDDEELQGDYTRDFLTAAFSHPAVEGVTVWGFWAKRHWRPRAAFLREDWSERPAGKAWRELVHGTWHTDAQATTGESGEAVVRGFRGRYEVSSGDATRTVELPKGGGIVTLVLQ